MTDTVTRTPDPLAPDPNLPRIRMVRNPAGGYRVQGLGRYGLVEDEWRWQAAIEAEPGTWSGKSTADPRRAFRRARLKSKRQREFDIWWAAINHELRRICSEADGLAPYEVAAIAQRSLRWAHRLLRRFRAYRQRVGTCRKRRWTGRYVFR